MALPVRHSPDNASLPTRRRQWLFAAMALLVLVSSTLFVHRNLKRFQIARIRLDREWSALKRDGVSPRDLSPLAFRLAALEDAGTGPIRRIWIDPWATRSALASLQTATSRVRREAYTEARRKAVLAALRYALLVKPWDPSAMTTAARAVSQVESPRAWDHLAAVYTKDRTGVLIALHRLAQVSGGLTNGEPADVLAAAGTLRGLTPTLYPGSTADGTAVSALASEKVYLALPPAGQIARHGAVMAALHAAIQAARLDRVLSFPAPVVQYLATRAGRVSLALYDARTGSLYEYNPTARFDTASIIKATIMGALLYRAQETHTPLSALEMGEMSPMIEESDNQDATDLWDDIGGPAGISPFLAAANMTATTPEPAWGLTQTTVLDQVKLLRLYAYPNGVLDRASSGYALGLMANVVGFERWGVSGALPPEVTVQLKNGWLPVPGGFVINSIGHVTGDGQDYVLAMLSDENPSEAYGIDTLSTVSGLIWQSLP